MNNKPLLIVVDADDENQTVNSQETALLMKPTHQA
jgi:hypothetical protein